MRHATARQADRAAPETKPAATPLEVAGQAGALLQACMAMVQPAKGRATIQQWMPRAQPAGMSEARLIAMSADALLLAADLLPLVPSVSGSTAVDRFVRVDPPRDAAEHAAVAALRAAKFRLLRLDTPEATRVPGAEIAMCDALSGEPIRVTGSDIPPLAPGTLLFARTAPVGDGLHCLPGAITPLDPGAEAAARRHPGAGARAPSAGARWAEAVYCHVVRHGTLDIPGLNRPSAYFDPDEDEDEEDDVAAAVFVQAAEWRELDGAPPDADLLASTRALANPEMIVIALEAAIRMRQIGDGALAEALERLLAVQLETLWRRERSGSGQVTMDALAQYIEAMRGERGLPEAAVALFTTLRARLAGAGPTRGEADNPELDRLLGLIQALRARTVERGCTKAEAMAAAEKVAALLDRHGLSLGELEYAAQPCEGLAVETGRKRAGPIDGCVTAIAGFFDCRVWREWSQGGTIRYVFFGLRGDVAAARYLHDMVERVFTTETDGFRDGPIYARLPTARRRTATNSFHLGLSTGIAQKLTSLRAAREATLRSASGRDLVPVKAAMVEEELGKLGLDLRGRAGNRSTRVIADALSAGREAGARFEPMHGIGAV